MPVILPSRLTLGKFVIGPDFHGCINTGTAPALLKSRVLHKYPGLARGYQFAVGPHVYVEAAVTRLVHGRLPEGQAYYQPTPGHNETDTKRYRVRFFKTYGAAKKHFATLVGAAEKVNARVRASETALRKGAARGDLGAAVALLDH